MAIRPSELLNVERSDLNAELVKLENSIDMHLREYVCQHYQDIPPLEIDKINCLLKEQLILKYKNIGWNLEFKPSTSYDKYFIIIREL